MAPEFSLVDGGISLGGSGIPIVSVVCNRCFLVHFYAAVPLGLTKQADQPEAAAGEP